MPVEYAEQASPGLENMARWPGTISEDLRL